MSIATTLALIFTVLTSVLLVAAIILLGWFLIWKAFLSKFRLVRELLGQGDDNEPQLLDQHIDNNTGELQQTQPLLQQQQQQQQHEDSNKQHDQQQYQQHLLLAKAKKIRKD